MKIFFFIGLFFFMVSNLLLNGQTPLHNDTIICIVDTTNYFTQYIENPYKKNSEYHWLVGIKGHYYDKKHPNNADIATVWFSTNFMNHSFVKETLEVSIPVEGMDNRFTVVTDNWLNQQEDLHTLKGKIGTAPGFKYNYLIFKQDLEKSIEGKVIMHRLLVGYNEVQY